MCQNLFNYQTMTLSKKIISNCKKVRLQLYLLNKIMILNNALIFMIEFNSADENAFDIKKTNIFILT